MKYYWSPPKLKSKLCCKNCIPMHFSSKKISCIEVLLKENYQFTRTFIFEIIYFSNLFRCENKLKPIFVHGQTCTLVWMHNLKFKSWKTLYNLLMLCMIVRIEISLSTFNIPAKKFMNTGYLRNGTFVLSKFVLVKIM